MKKFLPYIFTLVIIANILAPISATLVEGKPNVNIQKAEAAPTKFDSNIRITSQAGRQGILFELTATWDKMDTSTNQFFSYTIKKKGKDGAADETDAKVDMNFADNKYISTQYPNTNPPTGHVMQFITEFKGVKIDSIPDTDFEVWTSIYQTDNNGTSLGNLPVNTQGFIQLHTLTSEEAKKDVATTPQEMSSSKFNPAPSENPADSLPSCAIIGKGGTFVGCLLRAFYFMIFEPTSWLFAKSGQFFDSMFAYSIADSSYRNAFVVEGWGILRDMSNVFFIFILLYVAFATVLNIHGVKTKEMIINVVIIGLLINFSLFATQVIVDTSNILARVFYNSQTLRTKTTVGNVNTEQSKLNEISLSQGIVAKVDPQKIVKARTQVNFNQTTGVSTSSAPEVGNTDWFIVILMASAINVVGIIVFLSLAIFCIARVIGLWVSMVLVPVAFFSYTVPAMQNIDTVGWQKWWPETIKLAFMAPILMFFLYIILVFLEKGFVGADVSGNDILAVIIPFVFIMMFLWKAKDIAKKLSGEIGGAVMKAAGTLGGLAMGGGALLGAATVGRVANKIGKQDWLNNLAAGKTMSGGVRENKTGMDRLFGGLAQKAAIIGKKGTNAGSKGSFDFRQTGAGNLLSSGMGMDLNKYTNFAGLSTKDTLGGYVAKQQKKVEAEDKFAKSLGYDHHKEEQMKDAADKLSDDLHHQKLAKAKAKSALEVAKTNFGINSDEAKKAAAVYSTASNAVTDTEDALGGLQKNMERLKTGREKEYHLYKKRQSGKLFRETEKDDKGNNIIGSGEVYRDKEGNIKKINTGHTNIRQGGTQILAETLEGFAKGAAAASFAGPGAAIAVGIINVIRQTLLQYSGTTNRQTGGEHNHVEKFTDNYKAPSADHGGGDHGGGDHGGGDHGGGDHGGGDHGGGGHGGH